MRHYLSLSFSESDLPKFLLRFSASGNPRSSPARSFASRQIVPFSNLLERYILTTYSWIIFRLFHRGGPTAPSSRERNSKGKGQIYAPWRCKDSERLIPSLLIIVMGRRERYKRWKKGEEMRIEVFKWTGGTEQKERRRASLSKDAGQHRRRAPGIKSANGNK